MPKNRKETPPKNQNKQKNPKNHQKKTPETISLPPKNPKHQKNNQPKKPTQTPPSPQISESFLSYHVLFQLFLAPGILSGTCSNGNTGSQSLVVGIWSLEQLIDLEYLLACFLIADSSKNSFPQSEDWFTNCQHWFFFFFFFYVAQLNRSWHMQNTVQASPCFLHLGKVGMAIYPSWEKTEHFLSPFPLEK